MSGDNRTPERPASTPGGVIAGARRKQGLSLADLAERTKIPTAMLGAIEADEYHRLSGPLYARSFLTTCARELGLPVDEILDLYAKQGGEAPRSGAGASAAAAAEAVRIRRVGLPWGRIATGALAAVGVAALAFILTLDRTEESVAVNGPAPTGSATMAPGVATPGEDAAPAVAADPRREAVASGVPAGQPGLAFSDGLSWPVVVRLRVDGIGTVRARRDAEEAFVDVAWPVAGESATAPGAGPESGRAYVAGDGFVVYWGAVKGLSLELAGVSGVEVMVNEVPVPVSVPVDGTVVRLDLQPGPPAPLP